MKKTLKLSEVLTISALGMACGDAAEPKSSNDQRSSPNRYDSDGHPLAKGETYEEHRESVANARADYRL